MYKRQITGNITTHKDFNAEIFELEGGFTINGLLNADKIKVNIYWPCKAVSYTHLDVYKRQGQ